MCNATIREPRSRGIDSTDPAIVMPYLREAYGRDLSIQVLHHRGDGWPRLSHRRVSCDGFAIEELSHDGDVLTKGDTGGVVVLWTMQGRVESDLGDERAVASAGEVVLGSTGAATARVRTANPRLCTAILERELVERVSADLGVKARFDGVAPVSQAAMRAWTRAHAYVADVAQADEEVATPLVLAAAGRLLAATALATFPTARTRSVDGSDSVDSHPEILRRAIGYIETHAGLDLGVNDIAQAVYVTPRALQYMFRRHLDITPMGYLRRVRLDRVHHELLSGDRTTTTVTATAAKWGFAHTGRFAVLYRETYGKSPHVTLRD